MEGQPVVAELRALGLDVALDEAKAMRIKGKLRTIEGLSWQGDFRGAVRDPSAPIEWDQLYTEFYHAVAHEIVDAETKPETIEDTIPRFLSEYLRSRQWAFWEEPFVRDRCGGALLEWQGRQLQMAAEKRPPSVPEPISVPVKEEETKDDEIARREKLLADYKKRTGARNRSIYMGQSGVHKPQFYQWLKGKLPRDSATTQNFERFLRAGVPPVPRKPKG